MGGPGPPVKKHIASQAIMLPQKRRRGFTLLELMTVIAIIAALLVAAVMACSSLITWSQQTSNKQTLTILNDALTRYKCEGGDLSVLSQANTIGGVIRKMASTITWCGMSHQVLQRGCTYPARSLSAIGSGAQYQFTRFNAYKSDYDTSTDIMGRLSAIGGGGATQTWVKNALTTAATKNYLVLSQPATSLVIGFQVKGTGTLCYDWGDGTSSTCSLSGGYTILSHTYSSAGAYGVTLIGNVTAFSSGDGISGLTGTGTTGTCAFGGDVSTMPSLTYLGAYGANTLSGSVTNLTGLTYLGAYGANTLSGSVTNLTGLTTISVYGSNTLSGSITNLTGLTYLFVVGSNTISGNITNLTGLTYLGVYGSNTLSGSITNLTGLTTLDLSGANTITGSVTNLNSLTSLAATGNASLTGSIAGKTSLQFVNQNSTTVLDCSSVDWTGFTALCYVCAKNLTQPQVDSLLAAMWANKDSAKPQSYRTIVCTSGCSAPSAAGLVNKANLQAYKSPNGTGPSVWTVNTN